jgi:hypothetical protein
VSRALEEDHIKMLNLAFEWINCYVPHIMQKIDRVSFGIMNSEDIRRARDEHPNMPRSRFVTVDPVHRQGSAVSSRPSSPTLTS